MFDYVTIQVAIRTFEHCYPHHRIRLSRALLRSPGFSLAEGTLLEGIPTLMPGFLWLLPGELQRRDTLVTLGVPPLASVGLEKALILSAAFILKAMLLLHSSISSAFAVRSLRQSNAAIRISAGD